MIEALCDILRADRMRLRTIAALAVASCIAAFGPVRVAAMPYAASLGDAARSLEHAANSGGAVPALHVPPAPLGGPPRYSPSVDDWLQGALRAAAHVRDAGRRKRDLRDMASTLRYLATAASPDAAAESPRSDVGAATARIFADPAYNAVKTAPAPEPAESIWVRFWRWVWGVVTKLLSGIAGAAQGAPLIGTIFAVALIGLAVVGVGFVAYRFAQGFAIRRRTETFEGTLLEKPAGVDELYARARDAARRGAFGAAIALLFQASLVLLDREGRIAYDAARTAGEYRRLVRRKALPLADDFDGLARAFTLATYAQAHMTESDWTTADTAFRGIAPAMAHA